MKPLATFTHEFEGEPLVTLTYKGRPAWVARHIGARLGYSHRGKRLPNKVLGEWADEFIEGQDYAFLTGAELEAFKQLAAGTAAEIPARTRRGLLVLFESGLHMVLVKCQKPIGKRLRRFLVDQVLPQLVRTGGYTPDHTVTEAGVVLVAVSPLRPSLAEQREARLSRQAVTRERWVDLSDRKLKVRALHRAIDRTPALPDDVVAALEVTAAEIALGVDLAPLKPETERWVSPTEIAKKWGVSPQKVGRVITSLGLRDDQRFSKRVLNKARHADRIVISFLYNDEAVARIEAVLRGDRQPPQDAA